MIDKDYAYSAFLALRFLDKKGFDFTEKYTYRYPQMPSDNGRILVKTADDIADAIENQLKEKTTKCNKVGIFLSGGMDSSILASFLNGIDAYTFRFLGGTFQQDELKRAEMFANKNKMKLHYVDIDWSTVEDNIQTVMRSKGGPVHSIEPQLYQGALQAKSDGVDLMVIGDASDYIFGGMDKLLSKEWKYEEFIKRYTYVEPFEVLSSTKDISAVFEQYRKGNGIDYIEVLEKLAAQESYGSYDNAFVAAGLDYFDPYEKLKMAEPLNLYRIRNGESKYLIRELFKNRYPDVEIPEKIPMPRPVDEYFKNWEGPIRSEFKQKLDISKYDGNQKWLIWCLEQFLNMLDEEEKNG